MDSNYLDQLQLAWVVRELCGSHADRKIVFMHHPLYSSGDRHGSNLALREELEPILVSARVDVVFAGPDTKW